MKTTHPALRWGALVVGVLLIVLAIVYWVEPAGSLPSFIPGHEAGSGHHHVTARSLSSQPEPAEPGRSRIRDLTAV